LDRMFLWKAEKIGRVIGIDERSSKAQILMGNVKLAVDLSELSPIKDDNESGRNKGKERPWSLYSPPEAKKS